MQNNSNDTFTNTNFYQNHNNPYYIYAPRWISTSAGIKALHYLCNALNIKGQRAYLILAENQHGDLPRVSGNVFTPILTEEEALAHFNSGICPITILSETIVGNPINAPFVVRYLMNYVGQLGGPPNFPDGEYTIAFSKNIEIDSKSRFPEKTIDTLFIPPIDPKEIPHISKKREDFVLVYAGKYRAFVGKPPKLSQFRTVEIRRDGRNAQRRDEVISLLGRAKLLISFENSSIVTEAVLSGTPAAFYPNEFCQEQIAEHELGWDGIAWGVGEAELERATNTVNLGRERYLNAVKEFWNQLDIFIEKTQLLASNRQYKEVIKVPEFATMVSKHRILLAYEIKKNHGWLALFRVCLNFVRRRIKITL